MQIEVGSIVEGKVTSIVKFGAFVELPNNQTGLVHISEISSSFVNSVEDFLEVGQTIKVKVIDLGQNGRLGLSIKQAEPPRPHQIHQNNFHRNTDTNNRRNNYRQNKSNYNNKSKVSHEVKTPEQLQQDKFEDMMSKFKKVSDEKITTLKKNDRTKQRRAGNIR